MTETWAPKLSKVPQAEDPAGQGALFQGRQPEHLSELGIWDTELDFPPEDCRGRCGGDGVLGASQPSPPKLSIPGTSGPPSWPGFSKLLLHHSSPGAQKNCQLDLATGLRPPPHLLPERIQGLQCLNTPSVSSPAQQTPSSFKTQLEYCLLAIMLSLTLPSSARSHRPLLVSPNHLEFSPTQHSRKSIATTGSRVHLPVSH